MKGLIQQIEERGNTYSPMTRDQLKGALEDLQEQERLTRLKRELRRKKDEKHLIERAKELDKPIPWLLAYYAHTGYTWYTSKEKIDKYKEWFYPTQKEIEEDYIKAKIKQNE